MTRPRFCGCGCGETVPQARLGRPRRYVNRAHYLRATCSLTVSPFAEVRLPGDVSAARIELVYQQAKAHLRYARALAHGETR